MNDFTVKKSEMLLAENMVRHLIDNFSNTTDTRPKLECIEQGWGKPVLGKNLEGGSLCLADKTFKNGIATHCDSKLKITLPRPAKKFTAYLGVDKNDITNQQNESDEFATIIFSVEANGKTIFETPALTVNDNPIKADIDLTNAKEFYLIAKAANSTARAHADWADATIEYADGQKKPMLPEGVIDLGLNFEKLPISFKYKGECSSTFLNSWDCSHGFTELPKNIKLHIFTLTDPQTGLQCIMEMKEYPDFPAIWYSVKFKNTSDKDSLILSDIRSLDMKWNLSPNERTFVNRSSGHNWSRPDEFDHTRDFLAETIAVENRNVHMQGQLGRSSGRWFPFFNLQQGHTGIFVAVGWTGQWDSDITSNEDREATIKAGMEKTHFKLLPGEEVSQPSIMLMFLNDNTPLRRSNIFRRFMKEHIVPKNAKLPLAHPTWGGMHSKYHLRAIEEIKKHKLPYDVYWVDAGWYGPEGNYSPDEFSPGWGNHTGNWSVNPTAHPNGLKVISDAAKEAGMKFLIWVEPERVVVGTPQTIEHPEWFISDQKGQPIEGSNVLLNLGNPEALNWLINFLSKFIEENGVDIYRQDFNITPLNMWRANDTPERQGITEIKYIEGLYKFWDAILERFPELYIDNCASGGKRIDIETMSRSIPLWPSDVQCSPDSSPISAQVLNHGLNNYFCNHSVGTNSEPGDTYRFRSSLGASVVFHFMMYERTWKNYDSYPIEWHKKMCADYVRAKDFYDGDFYPLLKQTPDNQAWCAYEYWRDDLDGGIAMFFRRDESPMEYGKFKLQLPDENAKYKIENADTAEIKTFNGKELIEEGIKIELEPHGSCLLFIEKTK